MKNEYINPYACTDPVLYIRRCVRRRLRRERRISSAINKSLRASLFLLLWSLSLAILVGLAVK